MICSECLQRITEICEECGTFFYTPIYELSDLSNYNIKHKRDYKKLDHFKEVLNQFQAKEDKVIPSEVIQRISEDLPPMLDTINNSFGIDIVRALLRKHKLSKYNENSQLIWSMVSFSRPPYIKKLTEEKLIRHFKQIVAVYEPLKNQRRTSFLNYYYVLYKLLDLMKETDLLPYVSLLRTKQRVREHDRVWHKICNELGWPFKPTI